MGDGHFEILLSCWVMLHFVNTYFKRLSTIVLNGKAPDGFPTAIPPQNLSFGEFYCSLISNYANLPISCVPSGSRARDDA